ncbi:MAG: hypothetical protein WD749_14850 [Phycisphaerales bacterium]
MVEGEPPEPWTWREFRVYWWDAGVDAGKFFWRHRNWSGVSIVTGALSALGLWVAQSYLSNRDAAWETLLAVLISVAGGAAVGMSTFIVGLLVAPVRMRNRDRRLVREANKRAIAADQRAVSAQQEAEDARTPPDEVDDGIDGSFQNVKACLVALEAEGIKLAQTIRPQQPRTGEVADYLKRSEDYARSIFGDVEAEILITNIGSTTHSGDLALVNFRIGRVTELKRRFLSGEVKPAPRPFRLSG